MSTIKEKRCNYGVMEDEPPPKKLVSHADIFIKQLAEKQRNTTISLQEHLNNPKEFTKQTELVPLASYVPGTSTLDCFQATAKRFEEVEVLKAAGLQDADIELFFDSLKGDDSVFQKHKNWERSLLEQRLHHIQEIVKKYKENQSVSSTEEAKSSTAEHGLSVKPDSVETKLLKFALENKREKNKTALPHPMDNIKQMAEHRFAHLKESPAPSVKQIRRKARKLANRINKIAEVNHKQDTKTTNTNSLASKSKWDVREAEESKPKVVEKKTYTCSPQNLYTIRNGQIVKLDKNEVERRGLQS